MASSHPHNKQENNNKSQPNQQQEMTLHKFHLLPHNNEYFIGIIQNKQENKEENKEENKNNEFRIAMINKSDCWISKPETFSDLRNNAFISDQNETQFRNNLIFSLTTPKHKSYEIEEIETNKNKCQGKEIKIYRKTNDLRIEFADFKLYTGDRNIFFCLNKLSQTLNNKTIKNQHYKIDNIKFKEKYDNALELLNECIEGNEKQEQQLLNKFVLILNQKKKQIRALQQEIQRLKNNKNNKNNNYNLNNINIQAVNDQLNDEDVKQNINHIQEDISMDFNESIAYIDLNDDLNVNNNNKNSKKRNRDVLNECDDDKRGAKHKKRKMNKIDK
eukprot:539850_1